MENIIEIRYIGKNQFGFINGHIYHGYVWPVHADHFTVTDKVDGVANTVLYPGEWVRV